LGEANAILKREIVEREKAAKALKIQTHTLNGRIKELACLHSISRFVEEIGDDLGELFQRVVDIVPPSWQYPDKTCARLTLRGKSYLSSECKESPWRQAQPIKVCGEEAGVLEVFYSSKMPDAYEGPFLEEERNLINAITERLGRTIERVEAELHQQRLVEKLQRTLAELKTLKGIVPICSCCKKIRDDEGFWHQVESYVSQHTEADFSHGYCPDCLNNAYKEAGMEPPETDRE
jgi:hypothetical protein